MPGEHPFAQVIKKVEDPDSSCPLGSALVQDKSFSVVGLHKLVAVMGVSIRRLLYHLRSLDLTIINVDLWVILRTAAFYLDAAVCLEDGENPHVGCGRSMRGDIARHC